MTDLDEIKRKHSAIYERYLTSRELAAQEAQDLVDSMEKISAEVTSFEEYDWLRSATDKWRSVFISVLRIPRDITLAPPRVPLKPTPREERMIWGDRDLHEWLSKRAYGLAKERAVRQFQALTAQEMLRRNPSTPEQQKEDWQTATVLLAIEVLEGRIELTQLRPKSYARLEACWVEDIKRLEAYFNWLARGAACHPELTDVDYFRACEEIERRVRDPKTKRPAAEFEPIRDYLEASCVDEDDVGREKARALIATKAERLARCGSTDDQRNWLLAERYVEGFYGNIVPAVSSDDPGAIQRVTEMIDVTSRGGQHLIMNVLEVAVVASFVNAR